MSDSNSQAYLDGNLRFCENELNVSDTEGKMVLTVDTKAPPRHLFKNLKMH